MSAHCACDERQRRVPCGCQTRSGAALTPARRLAGQAVPAAVASLLTRPGRALDAATRTAFEPRFGHDLSRVRIHDDAGAALATAAVGARAFTFGSHIALPTGSGAGGLARRRLLAHELAHAVQQGASGAGVTGRTGADRTDPSPLAEAEARAAAQALTGASAPAGLRTRLTPTALALARDPDPAAATDANAEAGRAALDCDIATLCRLSFRAPEVVGRERVLRAFQVCHPGISPLGLIGGTPCLTPNFGLPPGRQGDPAPAGAAPGAGSGAAAASPSLPSLKVQFNLGAAAVSIDLPASLAVRLPVTFRSAERLVFALNASPTAFSFSITLNATNHLRVIAAASATPGSGTTPAAGTLGLTFQSTRSTCRADDAETARTALQAAGQKLYDALREVANPPAPAPDASDLDTTFAPHVRYAGVIAAIANIQSTIERVRGPCREVPVAAFEFGLRGPLSTPEPGSTTPSPETYLGGTLRLHF